MNTICIALPLQGYDLSSSTYSPDGRLFQLEYAHKAVDQAQTLIAIKTTEGVLFALQNLKVSPLLIHNRKMYAIDKHIGFVPNHKQLLLLILKAFSGVWADAKHILQRARQDAQKYRSRYSIPISGKVDSSIP